ncbi:HAMP domain-containing histidine kinase [Bacteroidales bacterium OttesenSCG-928-B11]|nr:HAMP domain-containing histidine kinase [Bacteroidales bacterium OttesenSCG-928-E04]MDL2312536.1 HAMP domain-containing histidine kinase [Bacteroidales bacterium OttesenSCG-928-B11]MDL2326493.1 HAMP domain-containing histidine kinase [Bacteroidales bacterium OttesenSCG-928-A14]
MDVQENKGKWKLALYLSAFIAFIIVIYYSNLLVSNIAKEERNRVRIWADGISYKAELVNYTEKFFNRIREEERKRASIFAQAILKLDQASLDDDLTFYGSIIEFNSTIPCVVVSNSGEIIWAVNVEPEISRKQYIWQVEDYRNNFDSISISYDRNMTNTVFYKESKIYTELRSVLNDLIQSFFQEIVINSASVPVIVTDENETYVVEYGNIDSLIVCNPARLAEQIARMKDENAPIKIELPNLGTCYVFYQESSVLKQLRLFPFLLFFIVVIFAGVAYMLFSLARKSEQNRVWVGMSKETAHQLGTPISSLMAWTELLKEQNVDPTLIKEMDKDVHRLETIAQRFSKIGSLPELVEENLIEVIESFLSYLQTRVSKKISLEFIKPQNSNILIPMNRYLFEWVVENLVKNAIDAMDGEGVIFVELTAEQKVIHIDIRDCGKGISSQKQKQIFQPGYTSKKRGWGLGLTLARRIINEYHGGKLFVKSSSVNVGTVMRITMNK